MGSDRRGEDRPRSERLVRKAPQVVKGARDELQALRRYRRWPRDRCSYRLRPWPRTMALPIPGFAAPPRSGRGSTSSICQANGRPTSTATSGSAARTVSGSGTTRRSCAHEHTPSPRSSERGSCASPAKTCGGVEAPGRVSTKTLDELGPGPCLAKTLVVVGLTPGRVLRRRVVGSDRVRVLAACQGCARTNTTVMAVSATPPTVNSATVWNRNGACPPVRSACSNSR